LRKSPHGKTKSGKEGNFSELREKWEEFWSISCEENPERDQFEITGSTVLLTEKNAREPEEEKEGLLSRKKAREESFGQRKTSTGSFPKQTNVLVSGLGGGVWKRKGKSPVRVLHVEGN